MLKNKFFVAAFLLFCGLCTGVTEVWGANDTTQFESQIGPQLLLQMAHSENVTKVAFVALDQQLVTGAIDGTLKWWNLADSSLLRTVAPHQGVITALAGDGAALASAGETGGVKLWNARTGTLQRQLLDETDGVSAIAFSADGSTFAAVHSNDDWNEVVIWDTRSWQIERRFQIAESTAALALSADGALVAVGGTKPKFAGVWETRAAKLRFLFDESFIGESSYGINALAFVPPRVGDKSPILATVNYLWGDVLRSQIHLWNGATGEHLRVLLQTETIVTNIAFASDGATLALRQETRENNNASNLQLWNIAVDAPSQNVLKATLSVPNVSLGDFAFSSDGRNLASATDLRWSSNACIFDAQNGKLARKITASPNYYDVKSVSLAAGKLTLIGGNSQVWDARTGAKLGTPATQGANVVSPDGQLLAEVYNADVRINNPANGEMIRMLEGGEHGQPADFVLFSPDSRILLSRHNEFLGENGDDLHILLKLWDVQTGVLLHKIEVAGYLGTRNDNVAFSPDSSTLAVGGGSLVQLWNVKSGEMRMQLQPPTVGRNEGPIIFSRDGRFLAAAVRTAPNDLESSVIKIWHLASHRLIQQVPDAGERAVSLAFSDDGTTLAIGEKYGAIQLRDTATGDLIRKWEAHESAVNSVAFEENADEGRLVSGGRDGTAKMWDAESGKLLATFRLLRDHMSSDEPQREYHDWIVYTPEGYYRASPEAKSLIRWRLSDELLPTEAKDPFDNPDEVAHALQPK